MATSNYEKEQDVVGYEEDDEQYVVDADDGQHYEECIDVGSETAVPAYYQNVQEPKSRAIISPNAKVVTARDISIAGAHVAEVSTRPFAHRNALPIGVANFSPGPLRRPPPSHVYFGAFRQREPNLRSVYDGTANYPIIGGSLSLPSFLNKPSKPPKSRRMASKRKPCNCTKSMCLKLYCDCFSNGEFCLDCNCKDCHNNLEHDAERSRAIKQSLERNPSAFKPKIGVAAKNVGKTIDMERLHQRGCHCKRSNCLKNYCECYEAKVPCTDRCKCQSCRNTEHDRHNKFKDKFTTTAGGLAQLAAAAAAESHARAGTPLSEDDASDICAGEDEMTMRLTNPKTQPWFYMTEDVIEATTMCLVSQAQEFEQTFSEEELEKSILQEFGRCLEQIIESANSCLPQQKSNNAALFHLSSSANGI